MSLRLTLVIHSLEGGGAERTMAAMANYWAQRGDHVTLITLSDETSDAYSLEDNVQRVALGELKDSSGLWDAVKNNWRRVRRLRREVKASNPDCVIAFTPVMNMLTRLACGKRFPVVIAERVDPHRHNIGRFWDTVRPTIYPRCAALVVQTEYVVDFFGEFMPRDKIVVIPNSVEAPKTAVGENTEDERRPTIVGVGRLDQQKGFDLLLQAFSRVADRFPDWRLAIYGEGAERDSLAEQTDQLELNDRVALPGWTADAPARMASADIFALSSRYEGFPNALLEAMAAGAAVVSFDCPSGPAEIVRNDVDGLLVPAEDVDALADALARLMDDAALRDRLGEKAKEVCERFSREKFYAAWDEVIEQVIANN